MKIFRRSTKIYEHHRALKAMFFPTDVEGQPQVPRGQVFRLLADFLHLAGMSFGLAAILSSSALAGHPIIAVVSAW